jgi:hypothetical protein
VNGLEIKRRPRRFRAKTIRSKWPGAGRQRDGHKALLDNRRRLMLAFAALLASMSGERNPTVRPSGGPMRRAVGIQLGLG